jgi:hypothetical protein
MLIPFANEFINPTHITRVRHIPGQRVIVVMADGAAIEVKGEGADDAFERIKAVTLGPSADWTNPIKPGAVVGRYAGGLIVATGEPEASDAPWGMQTLHQPDGTVEHYTLDGKPIPKPAAPLPGAVPPKRGRK